MRNKWRMQVAGLLLALVMIPGCIETMLLSAGAAAGMGSYKWVEGTVEKDYPRPMGPTWQAVLAAAKDLNLKVSGQQYAPLESKLEAVQPPDTGVKVLALARPNDITTVGVRFGFMGNLDSSAYFHRRIMHHLGIGN
jgi:hypothetical protein